jgi:hypothetical protein
MKRRLCPPVGWWWSLRSNPPDLVACSQSEPETAVGTTRGGSMRLLRSEVDSFLCLYGVPSAAKID